MGVTSTPAAAEWRLGRSARGRSSERSAAVREPTAAVRRPTPNGGQQLPSYSQFGSPQQANWGARRRDVGQLADWAPRAGGFVIDWLIIFVPSLVLDILTSATNSAFFEILAYIWGIGMWVWFSVQVGTTGSSPGMRVVGFKCVSKSTGQNIGTGTAILRWLLHIVDSIICFHRLVYGRSGTRSARLCPTRSSARWSTGSSRSALAWSRSRPARLMLARLYRPRPPWDWPGLGEAVRGRRRALGAAVTVVAVANPFKHHSRRRARCSLSPGFTALLWGHEGHVGSGALHFGLMLHENALYPAIVLAAVWGWLSWVGRATGRWRLPALRGPAFDVTVAVVLVTFTVLRNLPGLGMLVPPAVA